MGTHYDTLGIMPSATREEIRAAYLRLSKRYHPDKLHSSIEVDEEAFKCLREAYETLSDANTRRAYDSQFDLLDNVIFSATRAMTSFCGLFQTCTRMGGEVYDEPASRTYKV